MNKILLLFAFISINISAQINYQFLIQDWTKTKIRMLDGSKVLSEPYLNTKFYQWKVSVNKLCMHSSPIFFNTNLCINYTLEKNFIRTSPKSGYEIEKLTKDSLIVIERLDGDAGNDKVKKLWFVKTSDIKKNWIENTKTDSVLIANEHFTPTLNKDFIVEINQKFFETE